MITRFAPLALLALVGCVEIELTAPSICMEAAEVDLSTGPLPAWIDGPLVVEEQVASEGVELPEGLSGELTVLDGVLRAGAGDLAFVRRARVRLADASGTPLVDLLTYDRERDGLASNELPVKTVEEPVDVLKWMETGDISLGFEIEGEPSEFPSELKVDARICMTGQVRYVERFINVEDR